MRGRRGAVQVARVAAAINTERDRAGRRARATAMSSGCPAYQVDPFEVSVTDKVALLTEWSSRAAGRPRADRPRGRVAATRSGSASSTADGGTTALQQRVRLHPEVTAIAVEPGGRFETMRTLAPPAGRGLEYLGGSPWSGRRPGRRWDFPAELARLPGLLAEKLAAPSVQAGRYDLVIDPSNLWLTIHESIGHATELDRALGYEAAYAGTSFATADKLGQLRYGSPVMHVTGDRTAEHGLATVGYDDEGVAAQSWDLITGGVLTGYQLDRRMARMRGLAGPTAARSPTPPPTCRSSGWRTSRSSPPSGGPATEELIAGVERGHLHRRRQELVDRHAAVQLPVHRPALLPDLARAAGRPAPRRRLPGDDHRLLELDGGGRRSADLSCWAARSTAARASPARSRRSATAAPRR